MSSRLRSLLLLLRHLRLSASRLLHVPVRFVVLFYSLLKHQLDRFDFLRIFKRDGLPGPSPPDFGNMSGPPTRVNTSERIVICPSMEPSSLGLHGLPNLDQSSPSRLLHPMDVPSRPNSAVYSTHSNDSGRQHPYSHATFGANVSRSSQFIAMELPSIDGHEPNGDAPRVPRSRSRASARGIAGIASSSRHGVSCSPARSGSRSRSPSQSRPRSLYSRASPLPSIRELPRAVEKLAMHTVHGPLPARPMSIMSPMRSTASSTYDIGVASPSTESAGRSTLPSSLPQSPNTHLDDIAQHSPSRSPVPRSADVAIPIHLSPSTRTLKKQKIFPITDIPRYDRDIAIPKTEHEFLIQAMTLSYPLEGVPADWLHCVHPEGALYFFHPQRRIFTDANICNPDIHREIDAFVATVDDEVEALGIHLPSDIDLVLELEETDVEGYYNWCYYFADHTNRVLFWIHEFDIHPFVLNVKGAKDPAHMKHQIEKLYWSVPSVCRTHYEAFPHNREPPDDVVKELMSIILHSSIDQLTSHTSTATYTDIQLHDMLRLVKEAKELGPNAYTACVVGRLMQVFTHLRFIYFHGQYGARLSQNQSVHGKTENKRTLLISLISPFLYNAPDVHLRSLEQLFIDGTINRLPWGDFIGKMLSDWQEFILYATVMLNANVAFLTIPDVDPVAGGQRTAAQIASFISIIASIGGIILGLLLVRQYRVKPRETAQDAVAYLNKQKHPTLGLETLAILYSLPYALLMWGMVTFLIAFAFECFVKHDDYSTFTTLVAWVVVAALIFWCIYTSWDSEDFDSSTWILLRNIRLWAYEGMQNAADAMRWPMHAFRVKRPSLSPEA